MKLSSISSVLVKVVKEADVNEPLKFIFRTHPDNLRVRPWRISKADGILIGTVNRNAYRIIAILRGLKNKGLQGKH
jgi:hypothetical protein